MSFVCDFEQFSLPVFRSSTKPVQPHFILIMLCTGRALDRIAKVTHGWRMEAWCIHLQAPSPENNARLVVMMLEVLSFSLDTKDVVHSLATMERKIKEFERYTSIDIPEFLQVGVVIRQTGGPMRTYFIMNAHRLVLGHQSGSDECQAGRRCDGCGSVLEGIGQRSFRQLGKGRELRGQFLVLREETATERPCARGGGKGKSKGLKKGDVKGARKGKKGFEGKCFK